MLLADLSTLPLLSKKGAESSRLSYLRLREGMTIISCSGTIGRMTYVRQDMERIWSSQDVLKVVPDPDRIPPGYIYAFLSSSFGVPLVASGTYGAIIQHIEAEHISGLEVPRFEAVAEQRIHEMVSKAAVLRSRAAKLLGEVTSHFDDLFDDLHLKKAAEFTISSVPSSSVLSRLDAEFHHPRAVRIRKKLLSVPHTTLADWCDDIFLPGIFKRIQVEDAEFAAPYYTGFNLYWNEPEPKGYLSKITKLFEQVSLEEGMILVQAFGQEGGLTGRPVWVGRHLERATTTHMLVRLIVKDRKRAAYLYGFLTSLVAYRQISCLTYGGSIPHFDVAGIKTVLVPRLPEKDELEIAEKTLSVVQDRDDALILELEARKTIESLIRRPE